MRIHELGHVVLYVTDLAASVHFYRDLLGFKEISSQPGAAVFSAGRTHHEMLLLEIGGRRETNRPLRPGLYHIGFKIGDTPAELKAAYAELTKAGVTIVGASDHTVTHSLYIEDPDGNELELYIDVSDEWRTNPASIMAPTKRLPYDLA